MKNLISENSPIRKRSDRNRTLTLSDAEIAELKELVTYPDQVPGLPSILDHVIKGDMLEILDSVPDGIADLIIVDPPYNLSKTFNSSRFVALPGDEYEAYLRTWFKKLCDKLKPDGTLYMCGDWKCSHCQFKLISEELTVMNRITWQREKGRGAKRNWKNSMEDIWFAVKDRDNYYFDVKSVMMKRRVLAPYREDGRPKDWQETPEGNFRVTFPSNFWDDISIPFWSMPENTDHPTQKPEKLMAKLILASSKEGDVVLDPFAGSGTACVVAKKLGRHFIGIEMDEEYCLLAAKRLMLADENKGIQGYREGYFWERNTLSKLRG